MVFGLALVLALIFGVTSVALSASGGNFILGKANEATTVSKLTASIAGPVLTLVNRGTEAAVTALNINVASGNAPLRVNAAAGRATNLSADELDGKDSSGIYAQGAKVADSSHADRVDSAASASSGADADLLDGKDSSEFQPSDPCLDGTVLHEGACIETTSRGPAGFPNAEGTCLQAGRRLPTVVELQTFRLRHDLSGAEFTSHLWFDANGSSQTQKVMLVDQDGRQSVASGSAAFRCVAPPGAARSGNNPLEAAAQSDLRNAVAAANLCAAGNNEGSYTNCGTIAQLEANGYQEDPKVTLVITGATATHCVAVAQHDSGGRQAQQDASHLPTGPASTAWDPVVAVEALLPTQAHRAQGGADRPSARGCGKAPTSNNWACRQTRSDRAGQRRVLSGPRRHGFPTRGLVEGVPRPPRDPPRRVALLADPERRPPPQRLKHAHWSCRAVHDGPSPKPRGTGRALAGASADAV